MSTISNAKELLRTGSSRLENCANNISCGSLEFILWCAHCTSLQEFIQKMHVYFTKEEECHTNIKRKTTLLISYQLFANIWTFKFILRIYPGTGQKENYEKNATTMLKTLYFFLIAWNVPIHGQKLRFAFLHHLVQQNHLVRISTVTFNH